MALEIQRRIDDCPAGGVFYMCNGFRGCCTIDPCMLGGTCPVDKDLTPGQSSDETSKTPASGPRTTASQISTTTSPSTLITTTKPDPSSTPRPTLDAEFSFSLVEPPYKTITESGSSTAAPSGAASEPTSGAHSAPVAGIVGAVFGSVILCAIMLSVFFCIRRNQRTKVYKAPSYPFPLAGSNMTPQLSNKSSFEFQQKVAALYRADSIDEPLQLDSRELPRQRQRNGSIGRFAELPAERLPWPGHTPNS